jgi:hypothetical protein
LKVVRLRIGKGYVVALAFTLAFVAGQTDFPVAYGQEAARQDGSQSKTTASKENGLVIRNESQLPDTNPHGRYSVLLDAQGNYVPPVHWRIEKGALPPGIKLEDTGQLHGEAEQAGEFQFTASVTDSDNPRQAVQKVFVIRVVQAITLNWRSPAHVTGNRIDGSVAVSNTTADNISLTFDVKAVAENGRATEIGYQHFVLKRGTEGMVLPFGETLPHGNYVVHVDVAGEVEKKNVIYRERLQTPGPLQVVVGP